jgi:hypothetical protein
VAKRCPKCQTENTETSLFCLGSLRGDLGEPDKAFDLLESAYRERDADLIFLKVDPRFDSLRSDPRLELMLKKIGLEK